MYESTIRKSKYDIGSTSFRLAISDSIDCEGLSKALAGPQKWNSKASVRRWNDRIHMLLLPKETGKLVREPRDVANTRDSPVDAGCRSVTLLPL